MLALLTARPLLAPAQRGARRTIVSNRGQLDRMFPNARPSDEPPSTEARAPTPAEQAAAAREERGYRRTRLATGGADHRVAGATRPHLGVQVSEGHGLWRFFRRGLNDEGEEVHSAVDPTSTVDETSFGRAWRAEELRRKSFKDLHTLWYVLARERNLLATQAAELHRMGGTAMPPQVRTRMEQCRKSHARIKQVLNERRLAYESAAELLRAEQPAPAPPAPAPEQPKSALERITLSSLALRPDEARAAARQVEAAEARAARRKEKARWTAAQKRAARVKRAPVEAVAAGTAADRAGVESLLGTS